MMMKFMTVLFCIGSFDCVANPSKLRGKGHMGKRRQATQHLVQQQIVYQSVGQQTITQRDPLPDTEIELVSIPSTPRGSTGLLATILMSQVSQEKLASINALVKVLKSAGICQVVVREKCK